MRCSHKKEWAQLEVVARIEQINLATGMVCYNAVFVYSTSAAAGFVEETLTADETGCNVKSYRHTTLTRFSLTESQSRNSI